VVYQRRSELAQPLEADVGIAHERRTVLIDVLRPRRDDGEAMKKRSAKISGLK
jgi:hypothetical protein